MEKLRGAVTGGEQMKGAIICFTVPGELKPLITMDGGETDLHLTLAYLGDTDDVPRDKVIKAIESFAMMPGVKSIDGTLDGLARFNKDNDGREAVVVLYDSPELPDFRQTLVYTLESHGITVAKEHGFIPHIAVAYLPRAVPTPNIQVRRLKFSFDSVSLWFGDSERVSIPLEQRKEFLTAEQIREKLKTMPF